MQEGVSHKITITIAIVTHTQHSNRLVDLRALKTDDRSLTHSAF